MLYKDFKGLKLSALGMGCMRLPTVGDQDSEIDKAATAEMVRLAFDSGINYFDTAWGYHGGNSELVMGRVLHPYPRESFYLATKFPGFAPENMARAPEIFQRQLEKCQVDHFDFYLLHNVTQRNVDGYLDEQYGLRRFFMEQKEAGRIRHLGFSTHGSRDVIRRFLDEYGDDMEFCQIQLNYLDWNLQNAKAKVELLQKHGLPVWVMEPVRGGRLASLSETRQKTLEALRPGVSMPEWAFRFIQSLGCVGVTLSGMSNRAQLEENIRTFSESKPLSVREWDALMEISQEMIRENDVPCTACGYCVERCPRHIVIPEVMKAYNHHAKEGKPVLPAPGPADCIACRSCEIVCPQGIRIADVMADCRKKLG